MADDDIRIKTAARADRLFGLVDPQRQAQRRAAPAARHSSDVFGPSVSP
jgi:hypothetical protein